MKVAFVGGGKMAEAMIAAFIRSACARPQEIFVSDVSDERRSHLKSTYGINTYKDNARTVEKAGITVLAVKPQQFDDLLRELAPVMDPDHLVISIAAGIHVESLEAALAGARVVRVMPNLACQVGESMSVFTCGAAATADDRRVTEELLGSFGRVVELPESSFDVVTAVSGSGPAFYAYFLQCLADAGARHGLDGETAHLLASQTMLGAAKVLVEKELVPSEFVESVCSKGGTAAEGMKVLRESDLAEVVSDTVAAAARRSRELSEEG